MTSDNLIIIKGGAYNDIKKALRQWIEIYADDHEKDLIFELSKKDGGNYLIKVVNRLDNEQFFYLVNYLYYPEGIEYKVDVKGFTTGHNQKLLNNKKLLVYISDNDTEYDNVFVVTADNETFKVDFGGTTIRINDSKTYSPPDVENFSNPEIIRLDKNELALKKLEKAKINLGKRFKIISIIAFVLISINLLTLLDNVNTFSQFTLVIGIGIGVWFLMDYKMLQVNKYYLYCLFIALLFLGYGFLIKSFFHNHKLAITNFGSLYPISLLVVQKPLRLLYKQIFKREPVVDKPSPTFWDGFYTILLFIAFAVLPFIIKDLFK